MKMIKNMETSQRIEKIKEFELLEKGIPNNDFCFFTEVHVLQDKYKPEAVRYLFKQEYKRRMAYLEEALVKVGYLNQDLIAKGLPYIQRKEKVEARINLVKEKIEQYKNLKFIISPWHEMIQEPGDFFELQKIGIREYIRKYFDYWVR